MNTIQRRTAVLLLFSLVIITIFLLSILISKGQLSIPVLSRLLGIEGSANTNQVIEDPTKEYETVQIELNKLEPDTDTVSATYSLVAKILNPETLSTNVSKSEVTIMDQGVTITIKSVQEEHTFYYESTPYFQLMDFTFDTELVYRIKDPTENFYYYTENYSTDTGNCSEGVACASAHSTLEKDPLSTVKLELICSTNDVQNLKYCDNVFSTLRLLEIQ